MAWWTENLTQGQRLIVNKALSDIDHTPSGATVWVQGCAGTGKTLVLAHIARELSLNKQNSNIAFLTYTHSLKEMIKVIVADSSASIYVSTYKSFLYRRPAKRYEVIIIDEIQDVSKEELTSLQKICTHLIVAGDCEQRIYQQGLMESDIDETIDFNKIRLIELFRITESIINWAKKILPSTKLLKGEVQKEKDTDIAVFCFEDEQNEARWVYDEALAFARPEYPSAILLPTHTDIYKFCYLLSLSLEITDSGPKLDVEETSKNNIRFRNYTQINAYFRYHNIAIGYLGNGIGNLSQSNNRPFVYIMTYHSAKGLDFRTVCLPRLSYDVFLSSDDDIERSLFFVAVTRARERLLATYSGKKPYRLLETVPEYNQRVINKNSIDVEDDDEGLF